MQGTVSGKARRLARLLGSDGRTVIVPVDHAVTVGPVRGLEQSDVALREVLRGEPDAVLVHRGVARCAVPAGAGAGLIVHLSAGTGLNGRPEQKSPVCTVERAIAMGADAVSVHVSLGTADDGASLRHLSGVADACEGWGMPLVAMMYGYGRPAGEPEAIPHLARIGAELGADIVKIAHPGDRDTLAAAIDGCFVPVVLAGGEPANLADLLTLVEDAMRHGARGVCVGRSVWQSETPAEVVRALRGAVHGDGRAGRAPVAEVVEASA